MESAARVVDAVEQRGLVMLLNELVGPMQDPASGTDMCNFCWQLYWHMFIVIEIWREASASERFSVVVSFSGRPLFSFSAGETQHFDYVCCELVRLWTMFVLVLTSRTLEVQCDG